MLLMMMFGDAVGDSLGDAVGDASITKLWQDYLSTLLYSVENGGYKSRVCESIDRGTYNALYYHDYCP